MIRVAEVKGLLQRPKDENKLLIISVFVGALVSRLEASPPGEGLTCIAPSPYLRPIEIFGGRKC